MKKKIKIKSIKNLDNIKNESKICVFNFFGKIAIRQLKSEDNDFSVLKINTYEKLVK